MSAPAATMRYPKQPLVATALLVIVLTTALAVAASWAVGRIDRSSLEQERHFVTSALEEERARLVAEQDSSAQWDDSVVNLRANNQDWIALNLVDWMSSFFHQDRVYVIGPDGQVVRAAANGEYAGKALDARDAPIDNLVGQFRERIKQISGGQSDSSETIRGMGLLDTVRLGADEIGIVSIRPILPTTTAITQAAGTEYLLVSVKLINKPLLDTIAGRLEINNLHLDIRNEGQATIPLLTAQGRLVGFVAWQPKRPAFGLLQETAPASLSVIGLGALVLFGLMTWLQRTTLRLRASQAETSFLAFHDPLTRLANRTLFEARLQEAMRYDYAAESKIALVFLDLDRFKEINDTLGHPAGDDLIRQVAKRLEFVLSEGATLARLGGDEFALVQPFIVSDGQARWICQSLVRAFEDPFVLHGAPVDVTASFGVALEARNTVTAEEMLRRADVALYAAKAAGRNRFEVYDVQLDRARRERRTLEIDLRNALITGEGLFLVYQPIFMADSDTIAGAEALVRWNHPTRGHLPPDAFISIAEETGLITQLGQWVLNGACRFAASVDLPWVAVNVSPLQFRDHDLGDQVLGVLRQHGLAASRLELEITESLLLQNSPMVQTTLAKLRDQGIRIGLDDFGTGYSSLSYLRTYAVDKLKIDKSFIRLIGHDSATDSIVRAVITMAHALRMSITAEGVEENQQRDLLRNWGCTHLQGYLLSRPLTEDKLAAIMSTTSAPLQRRG